MNIPFITRYFVCCIILSGLTACGTPTTNTANNRQEITLGDPVKTHARSDEKSKEDTHTGLNNLSLVVGRSRYAAEKAAMPGKL